MATEDAKCNWMATPAAADQGISLVDSCQIMKSSPVGNTSHLSLLEYAFVYFSFAMESGDDVSEPPSKRVKHVNAGYCCSVPLCSNRSGTDIDRHFHRFPSQEDRRKAWIQAVRRVVGETFTITSNTRVCSAHFREQDYRDDGRFRGGSRQMVRLHKNAVPSVFAWKAPTTASLARDARAQTRQVKKVMSVSVESSAQIVPGCAASPAAPGCESTAATAADSAIEVPCTPPRTPAPSLDHDYQLLLPKVGDPEVARRMEQLQQENDSLRSDLRKLKSCSVSLAALKGDDEKFKHFTGLPNYAVFRALLRYLTRKAKRLVWWRGSQTAQAVRKYRSGTAARRLGRPKIMRLSLEQQFFLVLRRLRTAASVVELSHSAGIPRSQFSKMFTTWINFLDFELRALHKLPEHDPRIVIKSFLPFPRTRIIIDCTEVYTKRPSGLRSRKQLFSNYKHHNTVKFLVGISPSGAINFVSNMWGGRASDQLITRECGLLDLLKPGQAVMADRGFALEEDLTARGIQLLIPSFLGSHRTQLSAAEVTSSRRIAEARVHVERAIQRIKEFEILCGEVDLSMLHVLEQCFSVCSWLTNFQAPIVSDVVYLS